MEKFLEIAKVLPFLIPLKIIKPMKRIEPEDIADLLWKIAGLTFFILIIATMLRVWGCTTQRPIHNGGLRFEPQTEQRP